jgi:hypothetical protein
MRFSLLVISLIFCLLPTFSGCSLFDKEEPVPSYIKINSIGVTTDYLHQGTNKHKLVDAWVYVDNQLIGAFELPAKFPVLDWGEEKKIRVRAGIKMNGISALRVDYPFFPGYESTINLSAGQITEVQPVVAYRPTTTFVWLEDFDGVGHTINDTIQGPKLSQDTANTFQGRACGKIRLQGDTLSFEIRSSSAFPLPTDGRPIFMELHYKSSHEFRVGVITASNEHRISLGVNATSTWNKIYINLINETNQIPTSTNYRIFFSMLRAQGSGVQEFFIDNIKLLY